MMLRNCQTMVTEDASECSDSSSKRENVAKIAISRCRKALELQGHRVISDYLEIASALAVSVNRLPNCGGAKNGVKRFPAETRFIQTNFDRSAYVEASSTTVRRFPESLAGIRYCCRLLLQDLYQLV